MAKEELDIQNLLSELAQIGVLLALRKQDFKGARMAAFALWEELTARERRDALERHVAKYAGSEVIHFAARLFPTLVEYARLRHSLEAADESSRAHTLVAQGTQITITLGDCFSIFRFLLNAWEIA